MAESPRNQEANPSRLLRVTLLAYRNPNFTEEEFHHHWTNVHAAKASAHLAKFGIVSYRQYHTPASLRRTLTSSLPSLLQSGDKVVDYDGFVELLMPSLDCYERAIQDEYYQEVIAPDEAEFADMERTKITVGWEEGCVEDGKVVVDPNRKAE